MVKTCENPTNKIRTEKQFPSPILYGVRLSTQALEQLTCVQNLVLQLTNKATLSRFLIFSVPQVLIYKMGIIVVLTLQNYGEN